MSRLRPRLLCLIALLVAIASAGVAPAGGTPSRSCGTYQAAPYVPPVQTAYVAPPIYASFALLLTPVTYGVAPVAVTVPPAASSGEKAAKPSPADASRLDKLEAQMNRLESLLNRLATPQAAPPPTPVPQQPKPTPEAKPEAKAPPADPNAPTLVAMLKNRCAACHDAKVAEEKGGKFTLTDGDKLAVLNDAQIRNVTKRAYLRTMPPVKDQGKWPALNDDEMGVLVEHGDELRGPGKADPVK